MAFTMASFMTAVLLLFIMTSMFFNALDLIYIINDAPVVVTLLDLWCTVFVAVYVYHFLDWLQMRKVRRSSE